MVWQNDPGSQPRDYAPELHHLTHLPGANDYLLHRLSDDEEVGAAVLGSLIIGQSSGGRVLWLPYSASVPAAGDRNVLSLDNGDTVPTWKSANHNLLDGARHPDTLSGTVVAGDVIVGNTTPKWARLARSVPGAAGLLNVIGIQNGETVPSWKAAEHALLSVRHSDVLAGSPARGDLIVADATPAWTKLATGSSGTVLAGGTDPAYTANPSVTTITTTGQVQIGGNLNHDGTSIAFFNAAGGGQQASGANLTNNVTAGGVNDTIANFTDLVTYANDAATIRNDIYQLARKLKMVNDAMRVWGLLT